MSLKYAVIGDPVEKSLSPEMHKAGFRAVGLDAVYHRIQVPAEELAQKIITLKKDHYDGWNVTYPLKERIIPFLNRITPAASSIGAVNTVKVTDDALEGHNTDGEGFIESLSARGFSVAGKKVTILGAGGAAKAIAVALAGRQAEILILNRTEDKARQLAGKVSSLGGTAGWGKLEAGSWLENSELVIQTTSIGMRGESFPIKLQGLNPSALVADLIYRPAETAFLAEAGSFGNKTMNGLDMLIYQGALAWKYWFGISAPILEMRKALSVITGN